MWFCMLSLTPQGAGEPPKCLSGRLLAAVWWLFSFLFLITYTSNLAAFLTVSKIEAPVQSFDDLFNQFNIQWELNIIFRKTILVQIQYYNFDKKKVCSCWKHRCCWLFWEDGHGWREILWVGLIFVEFCGFFLSLSDLGKIQY